jgi:HTH-type transcriptional regulator/antitoxin HigA
MATKRNGLSLDLSIHPGETIKELLVDKGMNQEELAIRCGCSAKHVSEVLSGKKRISSNFANSLEYVFGIPTEFWINLQGNYDKKIIELENETQITDEEFKIFDDLKDVVKYCEKALIIEHGLNKSLTLLNMRKFLNVNNLLSIPNLPIQQVAFRGSSKLKVNVNVLFAWKRICEFLTEKVEPIASFDKELLKTKFDEIKKTMFLDPNEMVQKLKSIFLECGVVFDVVRNFTGAPVQGYIQKKNNKVILCMTIRQSFSDIFWFTLFHEIGHLINDDFKDMYIDYNFIESNEEKNADDFAKNTLINDDDYRNFKKAGEFDYGSISRFANSQNVKPGIVIGRIQNEINDYTFMAKYRDRYKWVNQI